MDAFGEWIDGVTAKPSNQYTKRGVGGEIISPPTGNQHAAKNKGEIISPFFKGEADPEPPPRTTADLAAEIGLGEVVGVIISPTTGNDPDPASLEALGLRAPAHRPENKGEIISPLSGDAPDPAPTPKTTADLAAEIGLGMRGAKW